MTYKNVKTVPFASLIAAMILPFSGMNFAEAEIDEIKYSKSEIDKSFKNSEGYVSFEKQDNQMKVDVSEMIKNDLDMKDIRIMEFRYLRFAISQVSLSHV